MSFVFEGQTFDTAKAFGDAFPACRSYRALVREQGIGSIADLERVIGARVATGREKAAAASRRTGIRTFSGAARLQRKS
ncbi:hypothetical protein V3391_06640 [Luteimonas sp. SMYT11W]|uniref:Uncharacterized protein n=1 Tax=Luteimonas flava TaxID=3115822 RepID=A0ABU7WD51_9GAMM